MRLKAGSLMTLVYFLVISPLSPAENCPTGHPSHAAWLACIASGSRWRGRESHAGALRAGQSGSFPVVCRRDEAGKLVRNAFPGVDVHFAPTASTPQSLAVVRQDGQHSFYRDLKDTPQAPAPVEVFRSALNGCAAALLTNIGWTRELLPVARAAGVPIVTDVQDIHDLSNRYDAPYFAHADVLFLSAAHLRDPAGTLRELAGLSPARLLITGLGESGALLLERGREVHWQPAFAVEAKLRGGAGDALAGAFAHFYFTRQQPAREALRLACAAAALKLCAPGSGQGHPTEEDVLAFSLSR